MTTETTPTCNLFDIFRAIKLRFRHILDNHSTSDFSYSYEFGSISSTDDNSLCVPRFVICDSDEEYLL